MLFARRAKPIDVAGPVPEEVINGVAKLTPGLNQGPSAGVAIGLDLGVSRVPTQEAVDPSCVIFSQVFFDVVAVSKSFF